MIIYYQGNDRTAAENPEVEARPRACIQSRERRCTIISTKAAYCVRYNRSPSSGVSGYSYSVRTVFYQSDAAATINFSMRLGAASIRERRLLAT